MAARRRRPTAARARALVALIAAAGLAVAQDAGRQPVEEFAARLGELADDDKLQDAAAALQALFDDPAARAVLRAQRDAVLAAVEHGRKAVAARPVLLAWYEHATASYLAEIGCTEQALKNLRRWAAGAELPEQAKAGARRNFATALITMAELEQQAGYLEAAEATAIRAKELLRGVDACLLAEALLAETRTLIDLGVLDEASERLEQQRRLHEKVKDVERPELLEKACQVEAEFYLAQDRVERAQQALASFGEHPPDSLQTMQLVAALGLAELRGRLDDDAETALRDRLRDHLPEAGFESTARAMLLRAALRRGQFAKAHEELEALRALNGPAGAIAHADGEPGEPAASNAVWARRTADVETLATRLLLAEHAAAPVAMSRLQEQLAVHEKAFQQLLAQWRRTPVRRGGIGFLAFAHRRQVLTGLIRLISAVDPAKAGERAAECLLQTQCLTSLARELKADDATLADVRKAFAPKGAGLLVWLAEPNGSLLLAVDATQARLFPLPGSSEIEPTVRKLQGELAAAARAADAKQAGERLLGCAQALSKVLLPAAVKQVLGQWTSVTVADYGLLAGLPWECLEWQPGVLLGEQFAVNTLTSLPAGVKMLATRYRKKPVADGATVIATLDGSPELLDGKGTTGRRLKMADVDRLLGSMPRRDVLLNGDATKKRLADARLDGPITHFLAHGARRDLERATGMALTPAADDLGFLGCEDAERLRVWGLVILSTCGAGRGHRRMGDEALHATLGGAFVRAGAHTVVQSSAELRLEPHLRLMGRVYALLARGLSPAAALRDARRQLAAAGDWIERFEHAQVQVFGLGHLPVVE